MELEHSVGIVYLATVELGQLLGSGGCPSRLNLLSQRRQPRMVRSSAGEYPSRRAAASSHFPAQD